MFLIFCWFGVLRLLLYLLFCWLPLLLYMFWLLLYLMLLFELVYFWISFVFALCIFGLGLLKQTQRPSLQLERKFEEFWFVWGKVFWISYRIVCIEVTIISTGELDAVAINGCGRLTDTMFIVAWNPPLRLGFISMKAWSSTARARAASGLAGLLFRSSHLSYASWRLSIKPVRTICSSMSGWPP